MAISRVLHFGVAVGSGFGAFPVAASRSSGSEEFIPGPAGGSIAVLSSGPAEEQRSGSRVRSRSPATSCIQEGVCLRRKKSVRE